MSPAPRLVIVSAVAENGVIGQAGDMPWRLPTDLKRFRSLTWGHPLLMGRRTFEAIGRPLPGRDTVVVTRDPGFRPEGAHVAAGLDTGIAAAAALAAARGVGEIMVVGGGALYTETIGRADALRLTIVHARPDGDTRFPAVDPALFREIAREGPFQTEGDSAAVTFVDYARIGPAAGGGTTGDIDR